MAQNFYTPITSSNINRSSNFFTDGISRKRVVTLTLKIPPHLIGVVTLPCEMSEIALKPVTIATNCVINVAQPWHVASKQLELKSRRLCCLGGGLFHGWFINVDNSGALSWANCHSVWLVALRHWSVASLAWVHRPAAKHLMNIWWENWKMLQLLWTTIETINWLFCC